MRDERGKKEEEETATVRVSKRDRDKVLTCLQLSTREKWVRTEGTEKRRVRARKRRKKSFA